MICKYVFGAKQVHLFVCWISTHAEYDFICSDGRQYTINIFKIMKELKYKLIKSKHQYRQYCNLLEEYVSRPRISPSIQDEIELLTLLIEKWDQEHGRFMDLDPVSLLKSFMEAHHIKAIELSAMLGISRGYMSDILHYKKDYPKK